MGRTFEAAHVRPKLIDGLQHRGQYKMIPCGDSFVADGNYRLTPSSITASGGIATAAITSHQNFPGGQFLIGGANESEFNGLKTVLTAPDANTITFAVSANAPAAATGTLRYISQMRIQDTNPFAYMNAALGQPFDMPYNMGVGGDTIEGLLGRLSRDVLIHGPDIVPVMIGYNDVLADRTFTQITEGLAKVFRQIRAADALPVGFSIGPVDSSHPTSYSAARNIMCQRVNGWGAEFASKNGWMRWIDAKALFANPTDATNDYATSMTDDFIHPSGYGFQKLGAFLASSSGFGGFFFPQPFFITSTYGVYGTDSSIDELNDHGLMQGTVGINSGGIGSVADGYTVTFTGSGTMTCSKETRANGIGANQRIAISSGANNDTFIISKTSGIAARAASGDVLQMELPLIGTGLAALRSLVAQVTFTVGGTSYSVSALNSSARTMWADNFDLRLRTPVFTLPGTPSSLNFSLRATFNGSSAGTFDIGQWSLRKRRVN